VKFCGKLFFSSHNSLTFDVLAAQLLHDFRWEHPGCKGAPEDGVELLVEAADAHLAEVPVRIDDGLPHDLAFRLAAQLEGRPLGLLEDDARVGQAQADLGGQRCDLVTHRH
jgi:hypothetical protein